MSLQPDWHASAPACMRIPPTTSLVHVTVRVLARTALRPFYPHEPESMEGYDNQASKLNWYVLDNKFSFQLSRYVNTQWYCSVGGSSRSHHAISIQRQCTGPRSSYMIDQSV